MVRLYLYSLYLVFALLLSAQAFGQGGFTGNLTQQYVVEGDNFMKTGDFNNAILAYTNAVNGNVSYGEALVKRAIALKLVGRATEGRDDLDKALRLGPEYRIMFDSLTTKKMRRDSLSTINNPYENLNLINEPADTLTFLNSAKRYLEDGNYTEAITYLHNYLIKYPQDTLAIAFTALAYTSSNSYDSAKVYLRKLATIDKKSALPYVISGLYNYKRGFYIDGIDNFNKAVQIDPAMSIAYFNRGLCKKRMGNDRGYYDDFDKAMEVDANVGNAFYNRGYHEARNGGDGLKFDMDKAVENNKVFGNAFYQSLVSKRVLTDYENLTKEYTDNINMNAADADALGNMANFHFLMGEYTPAVIDYNKALAISPQVSEYIFYRGLARILKNDTMSGCKDLKKSVEMGVDKATNLLNSLCK